MGAPQIIMIIITVISIIAGIIKIGTRSDEKDSGGHACALGTVLFLIYAGLYQLLLLWEGSGDEVS